ncbi:MAG: TolB family protein, partial [Candidatus Limnocylindria bacterium]
MRRSTVFGLSVAGLIFSMVVVAAIADAFAGQTTRVSVNSDGAAANMSTSPGVLSADGRYVVFWSTATNLVAGVFTSGAHVYRHDRLTGLTVIVSVAMTGNPGNNVSRDPSISANGRYVVFTSFATDLVAGGTNGRSQVFVRDMLAGTTALVSASSSDVPGDLSSGLSGLGGAHEVSDDGQHVVFTSFATNLAAGTNNGNQQVYVKNMTTREVVRASVNDAGDAGDRTSQTPVISGDGQLVAFRSESTNFSPLSTSGIIAQVFVHDLVDRTTTLESPGAAAVMRHSTVPVLSSDGRYLAFVSEARLDPRDLDNGTPDVYLKDRDLDTTVLASLSPNAVSGAVSGGPSISGDGRWVTFTSIDEQIVSGDTNGIVADVFLYDRNSQTVTIASRNDDGVQADRPSREPSLSGDGSLVVFASSATNLVPTPFTSTTQLYLRQLADNNVAPTVNLPSPLDLVFTLTLDATGSFTDPGPAPDETHSATVNYGDDSDTLDLALDGGSFALHHTYA